jgi:ssDNA-binding Zn-finger/Zn-ribbon topoisomerase 1
MIVKRGPQLSIFWGCPRFPVCRNTRPANQKRFRKYLAERDGRGVKM